MQPKTSPISRAAALAVFCALIAGPARADWTLKDDNNPDAPGRKVDIKEGDRLVARFIYGDGQLKPYLQLFGDEGVSLTQWSAKQRYPHHRGIFFGWNRVRSDLGTFDLWHLNNGGKMTVTRLEKLEGGQDLARLVATVEWRAGTNADNLLITETRTLAVSRPHGVAAQVDATYELKTARELNLDGDLQHAGAHVRVHEAVNARQRDTSFLWSPAELSNTGDKISGPAIHWCRFLFPIEERWYAVTQFNSPRNPVEELSARPYGRLGFFFKKSLQKGETLSLDYRFIVERAEAPAQKPKPSDEQSAQARAQADDRFAGYAGSLER